MPASAPLYSQAYRVIDSTRVPTWNLMQEAEDGEGATTWSLTIVVPGPVHTDTITRVLTLDMLQVTPQRVVGVRALAREPHRQLFVLDRATRRLHQFPLPRDVSFDYYDLAISTNGRWLAYVADAERGIRGIVRELGTGRALFRGPLARGCDCDVDMSHARWVAADSFEIAMPDERGWLRLSGSITARRSSVDTLRSEPDWH